MKTTEVQTDFQRFRKVIGRGLSIGLESNVPKGEPARHRLGDHYKAESGKQNDYIRHSSADNGSNLLNGLILDTDSVEALRIIFKALPEGFPVLFQRLNIRQRSDDQVLGLAFGRFPVPGISEEKSAFYAIKDRVKNEDYLNPDCLSRAKKWNPLFVRYHLSVAPSLKANEFGYIRIDVERDADRNIVVTVSTVRESEVPGILKNAETLPR